MILPTQEAYQLLHDGAIALSAVEGYGIKVDTEYLDNAISMVNRKIVLLTKHLFGSKVWARWTKTFGAKANLESGDQLGRVLFEEMGYECKERTETGKPKVDESALERVPLPFVKDYLKLSKLHKVRSTYLGGIKKEVVDGFLHPFFNLHTARTYRSSSDRINFQNLPIRKAEMSDLIRSAFISRGPKYHLVEVDYSGIEVKVAYCYHRDPTMRTYLVGGGDMHRDMAMECYLIRSPEQVSKLSRYCAKNMFVFPQFYGSYFQQCAPNLWEAVSRYELKIEGTDTTLLQHLKRQGITELGKCDPQERPVEGTFEHHIKRVEERFWNERFPVYAKWKKKWYDAYQKDGGFQMLTGFAVNGLLSRNDVINYPVQGAAFHCLLWSLVQLHKWMVRNKLRSRIVGQIHDSIVMDVYAPELQMLLTKARRIMTIELPKMWEWIIIPLEVEVDVAPLGGNWFQKTQWIEQENGVWTPKGVA